MTRSAITPLVMPKWGLSMKEGTIAAWLVDEGRRIEVGMPVLDVETDKIANAVEAPDAGLLRRKVAKDGEVLPVKALLGVLAPPRSATPRSTPTSRPTRCRPPATTKPTRHRPTSGPRSTASACATRAAGREAGMPVLFVHGFGGDLDNWLFNIDAVAETAPVIALDLPGHGQSDAKLPGPSLAALADFVGIFLDALDVARVHLVGHSMGGAIAAQVALDHPQRVASLTLIASAGLGAEINGGYIDGFVAAATRRDLKPVLEKLFADPSLVSRQMLDDLLKFKRLDGVTELLAGLGGALFGGGRQAVLPATQLPAAGPPLLVVWGAEDHVIPAAHAKAAPTGATVAVLHGAGHMVMMEKAGEVNALLRKHLAR